MGIPLSNWQRSRARYFTPGRASFRILEAGSARPATDTSAADDPRHSQKPATPVTTCSLECRRATVGCYLVEEDGTVWCVYNRCEHGYAEVTVLYSPYDGQNETAVVQTAVEQEA